MNDRINKIEAILQQAFKPNEMLLEDESHLHAGHSGHGGLGHFKLIINADKLSKLSIIDAHKAIYQELGSLMQTDIHALSIKLKK